MSHHVWGDGVVLRAVHLVTLATAEGELRSGWIPAGIAELPDDLVVIGTRLFTVLSIQPAQTHPSNGLPRWYQARPWIDPADQVPDEERSWRA